jgi:hypothetical protein
MRRRRRGPSVTSPVPVNAGARGCPISRNPIRGPGTSGRWYPFFAPSSLRGGEARTGSSPGGRLHHRREPSSFALRTVARSHSPCVFLPGNTVRCISQRAPRRFWRGMRPGGVRDPPLRESHS